MNNKRNLILIAVLFVAVLSACIIITIKENNAIVSSSSVSTLSSSASQSSSSATLSSANITSSTSTASSVNNVDVEKFLNNFKQENSNYQFFDFALSTCDFSDDMVEAAASYYCDKKSPKPMVVVMSRYGLSQINLTDDSADYTFAEDGKIKITGKNELTVAIQNTKTRQIYDGVVTYNAKDHGHISTWNMIERKSTR